MLAPSAAAEAVRPGIARRLATHFRRSLPPLVPALIGSACWALVMTASALVGTWSQGWLSPEKFEAVAKLYALGAALAFPIGLTAARFAALGRPPQAAFAAAFLGLSLATVGITGALFALDYRNYYATWHEDFLTITWAFQFVFTAAAALVQFAVLGVRLFFPIGFVALFLASLWFARTLR
jgi:hypothetical protein